MPVTLFSSTGALQFRPCRLLTRPVLVDPDYTAPSSEPDEIIDPPSFASGAPHTGGVRTGLLALLVFCFLQAAALAPPLFVARVILN